MRLLKALSLLAALSLLGGAVLDAQLTHSVLGASPDSGPKEATYMHATKAAPLIRPQQAEQMQANKDAGK